MDRHLVFLFGAIVVVGIGIAAFTQLAATYWEGEMVALHDRAARGEIDFARFADSDAPPPREPMKMSEIPMINKAPEKPNPLANLAMIGAVGGGGLVVLFGIGGAAFLLRGGGEEEPEEGEETEVTSE